MVNIREIRVGSTGPSYQRLVEEARGCADEFVANGESGDFKSDIVKNDIPCRDPAVMAHFDYERPVAIDYTDEEAYKRDREEYDETYKDRADLARTACFDCPIRQKCLTASLAMDDGNGGMGLENAMIWGGYSARSRKTFIYPQFIEELKSRGIDTSRFDESNR